MTEITKYGEATVKRIYGNFTDQVGSAWKQCINDLAIKPMQQFAYTSGKNATDGFMIIDAMDLLYTNRFDGYCIISSDSDFTALAIRIKEQGATVYGFGKKQTPKAFVNACSHFTYVENLHPVVKPKKSVSDKQEESKAVNKPIAQKKPTVVAIETPSNAPTSSKKENLPLTLIQQIFSDGEDDWMRLSTFGQRWKLKQVDFDPRTFGAKNFAALVKKFPDVFEWKEIEEASGQKQMYVQLKND